jgi:DNA-binding CsgD family transcriptional regulator
MFKLAAFSDAVLKLHTIAQEEPVERFQATALSHIQTILPFDTAWWGIMSPKDESLQLNCSHAYHLPATYVPMWEELKHDDAVAQTVRDRPKVTVYFDQRGLASAPGLFTLTSEHDIGQAFCTSAYLASERSFVFLSLYRSFRSMLFSAEERLLNQYLMPHLCSAWTANRVFQMEYLKANVTHGDIAFAIVDGSGQLLNAEPAFPDLLSREWAAPLQRDLPAVLGEWLRSGEEMLKLKSIVACRYALGDLCLIALRGRTRLDLLTRRELQIAQGFGSGQSYKEIARTMSIAPATVRHHIRAIYAKLEVSDKAEMSSLLHDRNVFLEDRELLQRYRMLQHRSFS